MSRSTALRRYPALGFMAVAAVLATLLPTALNVPLSGPSSLAELAPVPPDGQSTDQAGDLSQVGHVSSAGLGVGGGAGAGGEGGNGGQGAGEGPGEPGPGPTLAQRQPRSKRCVGTPLRQTEDPLSPPCVAHFDGDNGGATTRGVTKDEINVVIVWGFSPSAPAGYVDYAGADDGADAVVDAAAKKWMRYFTERYQTYGRRVHLWGYYGRSSSNIVTAQEARAAVASIVAERKPFAIVPLLLSGGGGPLADEAARQGVLVASYIPFAQSAYQAVAPRLISYLPALEDGARIVASHICRRLVPGPARYSGNVSDRDKERVFGSIYSSNANEPSYAAYEKLIAVELQRGCGVVLAERVATQGREFYARDLATLRGAGVTTVIVIAGPDSIVYSQGLAAQRWYPETYIPGATGAFGMDNAGGGQLADPVAWRSAFGLTFDYRRGRRDEQPWALAYRDACSGCALPNHYHVPRSYETLSLLMWGIQAAGPRLTHDSIDRGLHAIPQRGSASPYRPAAYFAPGNYSFLKDAMEMWWSGTERPPGDQKVGCFRLPGEGQRQRAGEWPAGDGSLFVEGPCQGLNQ